MHTHTHTHTHPHTHTHTHTHTHSDDGHLDRACLGAKTDGQQHDGQQKNHNVHPPQPRALIRC